MQRTLNVDIRTDFKDISEKTPRISDVDSKGLKRGFKKKEYQTWIQRAFNEDF